MKKLIFISSILLCSFDNVFGQASQADFLYANEALRFTTTQPAGSARIQSLGGAQTALGGDISNLSGNPAGLGFFNKSEFTISPAFTGSSSSANYNPMGISNRYETSLTNDSYGNLNINNLGIVFSKAKDPVTPGKWRGFSWGISYTTLNNYNNRFSYSGTNDTTSLTDYFVDAANGTDVDDLRSAVNPDNEFYNLPALAYQTFLIDTLQGSYDRYWSFNELESVRQNETVTTKGSKSQWNFAFGGNYNDKLYFGASVGLASFRYEEEKVYTEDVLTQNDPFDDLSSLSLKEYLTYKGSGINLGLGVIYRPTDIIRLGVSVQTPTYFYSVENQYDAELQGVFNNFQYAPGVILRNENGKLETTQNTYKFTTPWKLSGGVAFFFGKKGFITADADFITYDRLRLSPSDDNLAFHNVNREIRNTFKPAVNFRIGGEFRHSILRFRAGYGLFGSPSGKLENSDAGNTHSQFISGGIGVRLSVFYLDFGLIRTVQDLKYSPYYLNDYSEPVVDIKNTRTKGIVTLGFNF